MIEDQAYCRLQNHGPHFHAHIADARNGSHQSQGHGFLYKSHANNNAARGESHNAK